MLLHETGGNPLRSEELCHPLNTPLVEGLLQRCLREFRLISPAACGLCHATLRFDT